MAAGKTIDLSLIPGGAPIRIYCDQGDIGMGGGQYGGRLICCQMYKNGSVYTPAAGATAKIEGTKPDGSTFSHSAAIASSSVTVPFYKDMTDVAGEVRMQVVLTEGGNRTGSQIMTLFVQRRAYDNTGI